MQAVNIFTRDDTFFGVCEAIGEDFGFNANWLRIGLAVGLLWSPVGVVAAYAGMTLLVIVSRVVAPNPSFAKATAGEPAKAEAPVEHADNDAAPELAQAA